MAEFGGGGNPANPQPARQRLAQPFAPTRTRHNNTAGTARTGPRPTRRRPLTPACTGRTTKGPLRPRVAPALMASLSRGSARHDQVPRRAAEAQSANLAVSAKSARRRLRLGLGATSRRTAAGVASSIACRFLPRAQEPDDLLPDLLPDGPEWRVSRRQGEVMPPPQRPTSADLCDPWWHQPSPRPSNS